MAADRRKRSLIGTLILASILVAVLLLTASFSSYGTFRFAGEEQTCLQCHAQRVACDRWAGMAHSSISCCSCHDAAMDSAGHSLTRSFELAMHPDAAPAANHLKLSEEGMLAINKKCRDCHQEAYDRWADGGHGATYAEIFLNEKHNKTEQMADRCLVCHGMFFAGNVADLVGPLDTKGPWKLATPAMAEWPAIPCLACHQVHGDPYPARNPDYSDPDVLAARPQAASTAYGFFSRLGNQYFAPADLPPVTVQNSRVPVVVSADPKQRACYQCHAPNALHQIGTSDDRTPTGVHAGLSCLACHSPHGGTVDASCSGCHKPETEVRLRQENAAGSGKTTVH